MEMLYSFWLVLEGKTGKEMPESSRFWSSYEEFLEKFIEIILLYQVQKTTPLVHWIEEV